MRLIEGLSVEFDNDWRFYEVLKADDRPGVFLIDGQDYSFDGVPLSEGARIIKAAWDFIDLRPTASVLKKKSK